VKSEIPDNQPGRRYVQTDKGKEPVLTYEEALEILVQQGVMVYE
jgi:hypothetical protein